MRLQIRQSALAAPLLAGIIFLGLTDYPTKYESKATLGTSVYTRIGVPSATTLVMYDDGIVLSQERGLRSHVWYHDTDRDGRVDFIYIDNLLRNPRLLDRQIADAESGNHFQEADKELLEELGRFSAVYGGLVTGGTGN